MQVRCAGRPGACSTWSTTRSPPRRRRVAHLRHRLRRQGRRRTPGIAPVKPLWLDVQKKRDRTRTPRHLLQPGLQRPARASATSTPRRGETRLPLARRRTAPRFDVYGNVTPQQGSQQLHTDIAGQDYDRAGRNWPARSSASAVTCTRAASATRSSLVRGGVEKTVFISDAHYWNHADPTTIGAEPTSWNLSMSATGAPLGWKVKIKPGDIVRHQRDLRHQTRQLVREHGDRRRLRRAERPLPAGRRRRVRRRRGARPWCPDHGDDADAARSTTAASRPAAARPTSRGSGHKRLCLRGRSRTVPSPRAATAAALHRATCCPRSRRRTGRLVTDIHSAGFTYGNADLGVIGTAGIPLVKKGSSVRLWNEDSVANVWHTYTRCKEPCTGTTAHQLPDRRRRQGRSATSWTSTPPRSATA